MIFLGTAMASTAVATLVLPKARLLVPDEIPFWAAQSRFVVFSLLSTRPSGRPATKRSGHKTPGSPAPAPLQPNRKVKRPWAL